MQRQSVVSTIISAPASPCSSPTGPFWPWYAEDEKKYIFVFKYRFLFVCQVVSLILAAVFLTLFLSGKVCRARSVALPERPLDTYLPEQVRRRTTLILQMCTFPLFLPGICS